MSSQPQRDVWFELFEPLLENVQDCPTSTQLLHTHHGRKVEIEDDQVTTISILHSLSSRPRNTLRMRMDVVPDLSARKNH